MTTTFLIISCAVIVIGFIILFGRRVRANYGSIKPNGKVTESFESFEVKPDLIYYFSGPETLPTAIIGVDTRFNLDSRLWSRIDLTPEKLKTLVQNMKARVSERDETLHGFDILDNEGKYMGEWFSILGIHVVVKMGKENTVAITTPPIDTYRNEK
jgi:hypothetical protein